MKTAEEVIELLKKKSLSLSTAESCTGGLIAGALTGVAGSSEVFAGGFVTYSNAMKMRFLGVREQTLSAHGAVSGECASEMVRGCASAANTDCAVAVTGIAGPGGGTQEKPVGLVWIAVLVKDHLSVTENHFAGDRAQVRASSLETALETLLKMLEDLK